MQNRQTTAESIQRDRTITKKLDKYREFIRKRAIAFVGKCPEELDDLIQLATQGFLKADARYDPSKGVPFTGFAMSYVDGEIRHHLRKHWGTQAKIPRSALELKEESDRLDRKFKAMGETKSAEWIATGLAIAPAKWEFIVEATSRKPLFEIDEELCGEAIEFTTDEDYCILEAAIARLRNPYRSLIEMHYYEKRSLRDVAREHKASLTDVEGWLAIALDKIKTAIEKAKDDSAKSF